VRTPNAILHIFDAIARESQEELKMPRIIVTTDPSEQHGERPVLLDESVHSVHLSTQHAAAQLVERIAWAISDAEDAERASAVRRPRPRTPARPRSIARARSRPPVRT
jgi:hypothetical protein